MLVQQGSGQSIQDWRQVSKKFSGNGGCRPTAGAGQRLSSSVDSNIRDRFFRCAPRALETPQPRIIRRRSAEMQSANAIRNEQFDRFPHHEVIRPKMEAAEIRSSEFVESTGAPAEVNRSSQTPVRASRGHDEAQLAVKDLLLDRAEECPWLRRNSMAPPRQDVKIVKIPQSGLALIDPNRQSALLCLPDGTAR